MTIQFDFEQFTRDYGKKAGAATRANFAKKHSLQIAAYVVSKCNVICSRLAGAVAINEDNICVIAGVYSKVESENREFILDKLENFLSALSGCKTVEGRAAIKSSNVYATNAKGEVLRYIVEPNALELLLPAPLAKQVKNEDGTFSDVKPLPPEKAKPKKLGELYSTKMVDFDGLLVTNAFYDSMVKKLEGLEKNIFKLTMGVKKAAKNGEFELSPTLCHLDDILQAALNAGISEYLQNDSLAILDKIFQQSAIALHGKKRGLGAEIQRYMSCILPCLTLKHKGEGSSRVYQWVTRRGADKSLHVYGVESRLEGSNKKPLTPFISLKNWFILECELKTLRAAHNRAEKMAFEEREKLYREALFEWEKKAAELANHSWPWKPLDFSLRAFLRPAFLLARYLLVKSEKSLLVD